MKKNIIIESLDFLVWDNFQNCKYLETWIEMLCSFCYKNFVIDKHHVEKKIVQKKVEMNE
jgi:redox-regulated HSP33 family molecular chaperone